VANSTKRSAFLNSFANWRTTETDKFMIERGEGVYVYGADGTRYLEGLSGLWCASLGFSEGRLADAAEAQMRKLPYYHNFYGRANEVSIALADKLAELAPGSLGRVYFTSSGSEAIDTAVKFINYYNNALGRPEKKKIIVRQRAYHGSTIASGSATQLPILHTGFDLPLPQFLVTKAPHYLSGRADETESEDAFVDRILGELETMILDQGPETIAAFFAEPMQGSGGVIIPPASYFPKLQPMLRKYQILLVADEVITGFGRMGTVFGSDLYGIQPDIMTVAKGLTSAYQPLGAVILSEEIYQVMADASAANYVIGQGFTSSGHPVPCAVGLAALNIYESDGIYQRVGEISPQFIAGLESIATDSSVRELRAQGLVAGLELDPQGQPPGKTAAVFFEKASARGLIVRPLGDTVALCPPLIISPAQISEIHDKMRGALNDTKRELGH